MKRTHRRYVRRLSKVRATEKHIMAGLKQGYDRATLDLKDARQKLANFEARGEMPSSLSPLVRLYVNRPSYAMGDRWQVTVAFHPRAILDGIEYLSRGPVNMSREIQYLADKIRRDVEVAIFKVAEENKR